MGYANYGLRFLLELAALGSLAYWGFAERLTQANWRIDWVLQAQSMRHFARRPSPMP